MLNKSSKWKIQKIAQYFVANGFGFYLIKQKNLNARMKKFKIRLLNYLPLASIAFTITKTSKDIIEFPQNHGLLGHSTIQQTHYFYLL